MKNYPFYFLSGALSNWCCHLGLKSVTFKSKQTVIRDNFC